MEMIEAAFSRFGYPEDFLNEYDQMECLSGHRGRETFLVQRKKDGRQAVAKWEAGQAYRKNFPIIYD